VHVPRYTLYLLVLLTIASGARLKDWQFSELWHALFQQASAQFRLEFTPGRLRKWYQSAWISTLQTCSAGSQSRVISVTIMFSANFSLFQPRSIYLKCS